MDCNPLNGGESHEPIIISKYTINRGEMRTL